MHNEDEDWRETLRKFLQETSSPARPRSWDRRLHYYNPDMITVVREGRDVRDR